MPNNRKNKASLAAHAAAKRKSAAVELTADSEARVRDVLEGLSVKKAAGAGRAADKDSILEVYERLLAQGFQEKHVKEALQGLVGTDMSEDAALDWLCFHVDQAQLPKRFAGSAKSRAGASGVKVLARAQAKSSAQRPQHADAELQEAQLVPRNEEKRDTAVEAQQSREQQAQDQKSRRAWILQYMDRESDSEANSCKSEDGEIEDWELWGDPREIERRKLERKKASLPPEARKLQLAEEWTRAKAEAARAKAVSDKARQKMAGSVIRDLKLEMKKLGLAEEDLESKLAAAEDLPDHPAGLTSRNDEDWPDLGGPEASSDTRAADSDDCAAPDGTADSSSRDQDEDFMGLGGDMFDEDAVEERSGVEARVHLPPQKLEPLPWGAQPGKSRKGKTGKGAKSDPAPELKAPKALLQQLCHAAGGAPPKFEKLALGGNRLPAAGVRYSVTIDWAAQKGKKSKKGAKLQCFVLREDDDGWETIQEAQNAAATLALHEVALDKTIWHNLPKPYQDLWLALDAAAINPEAEEMATEASRHSFAAELAAATADLSRAATPGQPAAEKAEAQLPTMRAERPAAPRASLEESQRMLDSLLRFQSSEEGKKWMEHRQSMPVASIRTDLLRLLDTADVVVVGGDTGCGKTTQVPQYLLDAAIESGQGGQCGIICTQPRRIAATSVAERVCHERGAAPPGTQGSEVGYHVRLDRASTQSTKLLFCTTGILLRRLASDPDLASTSHVVVDEVHERTLQGDFLMTLLRDIVRSRRAGGKPLKVVLMSATLDSGLFARYYWDCPTLKAGGRTYPVEQLFLEDVYEITKYRLDTEGPAALRNYADSSKKRALQKATGARQGLVKAGWGDDEADLGAPNPHYSSELYSHYSAETRKNLAWLDETRIDYDLLEELVTHLASAPEAGAILVFLPGMGEINRLLERLSAQRSSREGRQWVLPLHSGVSSKEQRGAFQIPPAGVRKIVLATNIAETSLTISDVCFVVDSGKLKERRYDAARGMSLLVEDWISRANALQRKGRAGRVSSGKCFGLFTRHRYESRMRPFQAPEMVRVPLEELVLQIHLLRLGPAASFLAGVIEPPPTRSIQAAVAHLQALKALSADETLTPLGHHLAQLPVDARIGKLLLLGASLECLSPILTIAASLAYKTPFSASTDQQDAGQRIRAAMAAPDSGNIAGGQQSDHLLMAAVFQGWTQSKAKVGKHEAAAFARRHMLSQQTLEMIAEMRVQFATMLAESKFIALPARHKAQEWIDDPRQSFNRQAQQIPLVKAVLCAALYPNVAVMDDSEGKTARPVWDDGRSEVHIHPSSVNHPLEAHRFSRPYLVYLEKVKTSRTFLRDCSVVSPMSLLLFGGELEVKHGEGYVLVDGWIRVRAAAPVAVLVKKLRAAFEALMSQKIEQPDLDLGERGAELVQTLVKLLCEEEAAQRWSS